MKEDMSSLRKTSASSSGDEDAELRRGPWTLEEDTLLIDYIASHGEGHWNQLAKHSGLKRTGKSCRLRWLNYLKPDVKRGNLSPEEQLLILELHSKWGNRWSKIAQYLPGRTDNEIKNYWRTRVQKQARHLKIDSNSAAFQGVIRSFWIPRLLQKIQASSPYSAVQFQSSSSTSQPPQATNHLSVLLPQAYEEGHLQIRDMEYDLDNQNKIIGSYSLESMRLSQNLQVSEYTTSPFRAMASTDEYCNSLLMKGCQKMNVSHDVIGAYGLAATSTPGGSEDPMAACHVGQSTWRESDLPDSFWDMDESCQLRYLENRAC